MPATPPPGDGDHLHRLDEDTWLLGKLPSSSSPASIVDASDFNAVLPVAKSFPSYTGGHCTGKIVRKKDRSRTRGQLGKLLRSVHWLKQSNRQLHKQMLELKQLVVAMRNDRTALAISFPVSPSKRPFDQMTTRDEFEQFETAVLDVDYRHRVTSYLCTLGGDTTVTFAQRIFASLFADGITCYITFFGTRQNKRPFFGSTTYDIVLDVFKRWNADNKSDLYQLEGAFRYAFKKGYDRLCKRGYRQPDGFSSENQTQLCYT
uniref:DUF4806 domain-containing protein n=1 Tax=Schistocephalus solidus TaxID=70667 RepID=A0A0X3NXE5_SCHSO